MDIFIDDASPQLVYRSNSSGWITDHRNGTTWPDPTTDQYSFSTFHATSTEGDSLTVKFNATTVSLYGAKRPNHGIFGVIIDGGDEQFVSGWAEGSVYGQRLFKAVDLSAEKEHTMTVTNYPSKTTGQTDDGTGFWLDIDYIVFHSSLDDKEQVFTTILDDTSPAVTYDDAWAPDGDGDSASYNQTEHVSTTQGSGFTLNFNGSSIQVFAAVGPNHGQYSVSADGGEEETFNSSWPETVYKVPTYTISNLPDSPHTLKFTNLEAKSLGFDYAVINSTLSSSSFSNASSPILLGTTVSSASESVNSEEASESTRSVGAIAGGIAGGAVGLGLVFLLAWVLFWRKKGDHSRLEYGDGDADGLGRRSSFYYSKPPQQTRSRSQKSTCTTVSTATTSMRSMRRALVKVDLAEKSDDDDDSDCSSASSRRDGPHSRGGSVRESLHAPLSAPLVTPRSGGFEAQMSRPAQPATGPQYPALASSTPAHDSRPFLTLVPPPPTSNATSYIPSAGPSRGPNTLGRVPFRTPAPSTTAPSVYSQEGTYVEPAPEPLEPRHVRGGNRQGQGEGERGELLEDKYLSWGSRASGGNGGLNKLQRESAYALSTPGVSQSRSSTGGTYTLRPLPRTPLPQVSGHGNDRDDRPGTAGSYQSSRGSRPGIASSQISAHSLHVTSPPSSQNGASPVSPPPKRTTSPTPTAWATAAGNISSTELAYKTELVSLPYTASLPRNGRAGDIGRAEERIKVPGREVDMGPLPAAMAAAAAGNGGSLPPGYSEALRGELGGGRR
ncbi:hypothetical protein L202_01967 [Cryptococcus amylolentus CBS 6039]|uniref:Transmembrane protein n=2 Tax=Cryptococcus amylolentus TaxID=104669 RepID=A0A1E3HZ09_9TREE|nr:hypothetical protein L202_01967 [Cryptococcus amylolentus CBS 6039]ODN81549.1 hypothetical protein L202_01967 [Cryptococcus amylolentus CBS 6039]ODO10222.1 hypothetical protein I350_02451 [Cryptococcus amylolentus CBS 6273]